MNTTPRRTSRLRWILLILLVIVAARFNKRLGTT